MKPKLTLKVAITLDACINTSSGSRLILSSKEDLEAVDMLRADSDAILIGAGTLRADNPKLLVRSDKLRTLRLESGKSENPIKVCLSNSLDIDPAFEFFTSGKEQKLLYVPKSNLTTAQRIFSTIVDCIGIGEQEVDFKLLLEDLYSRGVRKLLVEGGTQITSSLLRLGLVDELRLAIAPVILGDSSAPRFVENLDWPLSRLEVVKEELLGDMRVLWFRF